MTKRFSKRINRLLFGMAVILSACGVITLLMQGQEATSIKERIFEIGRSRQDIPSGITLQSLLEMKAPPSNYLDLAAVSFACASGLPGTEGFDDKKGFVTLDKWARHIKAETDKRYTSYFARPGYYDNSVSKFKIIILILTLQEDYGVGYNMNLANSKIMMNLQDPSFFHDSKDVFLHGTLTGNRKGTCSSLPILIIVLGRRLGYPLRLVTTRGHLYARWDSPDERFNIECSMRGVDFYPDEYYKKWPCRPTQAQVNAERFFVSLTPGEEIAILTEIRGYCLDANARYREAAIAYGVAMKWRPTSQNLPVLLRRVQSLSEIK